MAPRLLKRFGQHHLTDGALCGPAVDFLEPEGHRVVEIGPGGGILTRELLAAGARVLAWELDPAWAWELERRHRARELGQGDLRLVLGDALDLPWETLPAPTRVAGNLPFNVGTPILRHLLARGRGVDRAAVMVQLEVADRLAAVPGDPAYGGLSVLVAARARVRLLGRVKKGSFHPPPKVDAAFVGLELRPPPRPAAEMPAFEAVVRLAFSQRRKTLRNALASGWGRGAAEAAMEEAGLDPSRRAEELDLEAFLDLHRARRKILLEEVR